MLITRSCVSTLRDAYRLTFFSKCPFEIEVWFGYLNMFCIKSCNSLNFKSHPLLSNPATRMVCTECDITLHIPKCLNVLLFCFLYYISIQNNYWDSYLHILFELHCDPKLFITSQTLFLNWIVITGHFLGLCSKLKSAFHAPTFVWLVLLD